MRNLRVRVHLRDGAHPANLSHSRRLDSLRTLLRLAFALGEVPRAIAMLPLGAWHLLGGRAPLLGRARRAGGICRCCLRRGAARGLLNLGLGLAPLVDFQKEDLNEDEEEEGEVLQQDRHD